MDSFVPDGEEVAGHNGLANMMTPELARNPQPCT
jgi:hypothetical protein